MVIYECRELKKGLWMIGERMSGKKYDVSGALSIYLIVGDEKAALIDSGMGITRDLRKVCEEITDKPIVCCVTHGHPDHAGGACLFDEILMCPEDEVDLPWALPAQKRFNDLVCFSEGNEELVQYVREHMVQDASFSYKPLKDGDILDLGGTVLEVISVPGHTPGSMCFYNRKEGYVCVGDAVSFHQMFGASSATVEVYGESLKRFLSIVSDDVEIYTGHRGAALTTEAPKQMILNCEEVLQGKTQEDVPHIPMFLEQREAYEYKTGKMMVHTMGACSLVYNATKIK